MSTARKLKTLQPFPRLISYGALKISEREKELVNEVLDSNQLSYGDYSRKFEREMAKLHEAKYGLFMNSGTSALHIALTALKELHGWEDGDEVICPSVTFIATSNIVLHNNLKPVFADVQKSTFNIDPKEIEKKITKKTRAIIPVHILGLPCDMDEIIDLANKHDLKILEDTCECMYAKYKDRFVGTLGDIGCFSTYAAKLIVTGVGGLAVTNNEDYAVSMRSLMNHGRNNIYIESLEKGASSEEEKKEIIDKRFSFESIGHSSRCTEMEAAIGLGQIERIDEIVEKRRDIARQLTEGLSPLKDYLQLPTCPSDRTYTNMAYGLALKNEEKTNLINFLEEHNIETREMLPLLNQPVYEKKFGKILNDYPVAKWANDSAFYVGCHPFMEQDEIDYIIEAFHYYFSM